MYRVLVPVDRDVDRASRQARYVASFPNASTSVEATVLYVVPPGELDRAEEVQFSEVDAAVEAADYLEAQDVAVDRVVDDGGVSEQIVRTATDLESDELVMGGRKRSGVTQVLLGSTVQDVFLSTEQAVTITGSGMKINDGQRRVLLPVDGDRKRARHQAEYVTGLPGAPEQVEATVLTVFRHQDYKGAPEHSFEEVDAAVEAADFLEDEGVEVERVAVGGEVTRKIHEAAEERDVHGIVVGGRKRSGVQKVLVGSTAQDVMLSADRPVTLTG